MNILILTGPGGDAQGWGDRKVTESVAEAAETVGVSARIAYVETEKDFLKAIDQKGFALIWSALYHISANEKFIGTNVGGMWVADVLDSRGIPYIGSNSQAMKNMIDKFQTHTILAAHSIPVPSHRLVQSRDDVSTLSYPAFVKPMCESRSVGISDESVVYSEKELLLRVALIEQEFDQAALVEEFLPGDEYTVLVLDNGKDRECLPGLVSVEEKYYGKHKVLRSDLRGVGLTRISSAGNRANEAKTLADRAADAMDCLDHVRIDLKIDASGRLKIMEVNGIPGLKPHKSWAPQLYTLHHGLPGSEIEDYRSLIRRIIESARRRYGL